MSRNIALAAALGLALLHGVSLAETRITRPIRLVVPYVPGGGTDTLARLVAPYIAQGFGQQVVIDNRAGGNSTIGTQIVAHAAPDGETIGIVDAAFVANPSLADKLPYDTLRDFTPVALVAAAPLALLVAPAVEARSVKALVALAKAQPDRLTFGSAGTGSATHVAGEQFRSVTGIDIVHVPYKGSGQSITELLGSHITMAFTGLSTAKPHTSAGRVRALGTTGGQRTQVMPDVPTFAEAGYPGVDTTTLTGIIAPARIPRDYVVKLNAILMKALAAPELKARYHDLGYEATPNTPDEYAKRIRVEIEKFGRVIKAAGTQRTQP